MPAVATEETILLKKAIKKITDLKDDIRRLFDELRKKDSLLSSYFEKCRCEAPSLMSFLLYSHIKPSPGTSYLAQGRPI